KVIGLDDDLETLAQKINSSAWDEDNKVEQYTSESLQAYLGKDDTLFVVCYLVDGDRRILGGMASARIEQKPYDFSKWLYIDEVDTCSNHRQKGIGTVVMKCLLDLAEENDCEEVVSRQMIWDTLPQELKETFAV
ncbi:MAG: GNAT family N-acetyltransferase, partial [Candidatus Peribacter sp.]|nr:GNAT family N-acetyltransferase [Candidatus Peribacter sp.]